MVGSICECLFSVFSFAFIGSFYDCIQHQLQNLRDAIRGTPEILYADKRTREYRRLPIGRNSALAVAVDRMAESPVAFGP